MKFVQLILRKIIKIVNCHQTSDFKANAPNSISAGVPPQTPLRELRAPQTPLLDFRGLLLRDGRGGDEREEGKGEGPLCGRRALSALNPPLVFKNRLDRHWQDVGI